MERKPIFVATHTRSCSTAFERIFMTRRDVITCLHEPFGDAFYYGPEKISPAWLRWPADKIENTGRAHYTYDYVLHTILDTIKDQGPTKRVLLKDMTYHIIPPSHSPNAIAPSLQYLFSPNDAPNPTLLPNSLLHTFQFVFLIRKPSASIPSLYRCFIPPLSEKTNEDTLDPHELGYRETRLLFDYLYPPALRSPYSPFRTASEHGAPDTAPILIDAEDLLSHPKSILRSFCTRLALPYSSSMLSWSTTEDHVHAVSLFKKYAGYHEDALNSTGLRRKAADGEDCRREAKTREEEDEEWKKKYGSEAAWKIREAVDHCQEDYEYLKEFRIKPQEGGNEGEGENEHEVQDQDIEEKAGID